MGTPLALCQMLLKASMSMHRPVVDAKKPIEAVLKEGAEFVVIVPGPV